MMGILNVTPDSFSDGGKFNTVESAVERAMFLVKSGCDILDIGGQSTRPGAKQVSAEEELARVLPVIQALQTKSISVPLSIDTFYSETARKAVQCGVSMINDVSGGTIDKAMFPTVAELRVPYILSHIKYESEFADGSRGTPETMTGFAQYENVVEEVSKALHNQVKEAMQQGVFRWHIILDPGLGFAKKREHSLEILRKGTKLLELGFPMLYGPSRKGFLGGAEPSQRVWGTTAAVTACVQCGADVVRVHDVAEMKQVIDVADAIYRGQ